MSNWTDQDLYRLDAILAEQGVNKHARAMHAAELHLGHGFALIGGTRTQANEFMDDWHRLFPDHGNAWPGTGVGFTAVCDTVRTVVSPVPFAARTINPLAMMDFATEAEFLTWCRNDRSEQDRAILACADVADFALGQSEVGYKDEAADRWRNAKSHLAVMGAALQNVQDLNALTQSICLVFELTLKATLYHLGYGNSVTKFSHRNEAMLCELVQAKPHRDDDVLASIVTSLPHYVNSRYTPDGRGPLGYVKLALGAQFCAASTIRRFSTCDFSGDVEAQMPQHTRERMFS